MDTTQIALFGNSTAATLAIGFRKLGLRIASFETTKLAFWAMPAARFAAPFHTVDKETLTLFDTQKDPLLHADAANIFTFTYNPRASLIQQLCVWQKSPATFSLPLPTDAAKNVIYCFYNPFFPSNLVAHQLDTLRLGEKLPPATSLHENILKQVQPTLTFLDALQTLSLKFCVIEGSPPLLQNFYVLKDLPPDCAHQHLDACGEYMHAYRDAIQLLVAEKGIPLCPVYPELLDSYGFTKEEYRSEKNDAWSANGTYGEIMAMHVMNFINKTFV